MRHRKAGVKLNRTSSHRKAMFRNMVTSLIKHGKIRTTDAKAKELRRWGDKLVTLAKRGDLHARRQALAIVTEAVVVKKLFDEAAERFGNISGGYTRVVKLGRRPGDAASMSLVDFVVNEDKRSKKSKKKAKKTVAESIPKESKLKKDEIKSDSKKEIPESAPDADETAEDVGDQKADTKTASVSSEPVEDTVVQSDGGADAETKEVTGEASIDKSAEE